jgi:hypothetical protein
MKLSMLSSSFFPGVRLNCRIPIWYEVKLLFVAWLVLPQSKGAAFLYERFVREQIKKNGWFRDRQD